MNKLEGVCLCWNCLLEIWSNVHVWGRQKVTGVPGYWLICPCVMDIGLLTSRCSWCLLRQVLMLRLGNRQSVLICHCHCISLLSFAYLPRIRSARLLNFWPFVTIVCLNLLGVYCLFPIISLVSSPLIAAVAYDATVGYLRRTYKTFFCLFS